MIRPAYLCPAALFPGEARLSQRISSPQRPSGDMAPAAVGEVDRVGAPGHTAAP